MKIKPHNFVFILISSFCPWRYTGTFVEIEGDTIIFHRYFCKENSFSKEIISLNINQVMEIGFPTDLKIAPIESTIAGVYGVYRPQEIIFKTTDANIAFNARPYTKKQIIMIIKNFQNAKIGRKLSKILKINNI